MNKRALLSLTVGVALAGLAVVMVYRELDRPVVEAEAPFKVVPMVVAMHDIGFGATLRPQLLKVTAWPDGSVPAGSFRSIEELLGDGSEERVALKPIAAGEPLLAAKVSGFGGRATMSSVLPEDKRGFSIRVNDVSGVGGFLLPGDRVDILLTRMLPGDREKTDQVTDVILQNIVVRGIDQIADEDRNKPQVVRTVTVEVTPEEAQKLALAMEVGGLSLALRNVVAVEQQRTRTVRVADLAGETPKPAPVRRRAAAAPPPSVRVWRGIKVEEVNVGG